MYPHERSLVKRLKDQPFALLGVNSDEDLEGLKPSLEEATKLTEDAALDDRAKSLEFEARNLVIGDVAPDIFGVDIDGVPFKLSDYRGKVVVIDFWGDW